MDLWQEIRYALRTLVRSPLFTAAAVLSLALGTGATTAIFSVVDAVLLRPLPFPTQDRLTMIWGQEKTAPDKNRPIAPADYFDYRERIRSFQQIEGFYSWTYSLTESGDPARVSAGVSSAGFLPMFGSKPVLGRFFRPEEEGPGKAPVAILSHAMWESRFGADTGVLGQKILLDDKPYTVVGVMPSGFDFPESTDLWLPLTESREGADRSFQFLRVVGLLEPGASLEAAQAEMAGLARGLEQQFPDTNEGRGAIVIPLRTQLVGKVQQALLILLGAVVLLLCIACANVANLMLVRATFRREELAVRCALGASLSRLARLFLIESLLLSVTGGLLGLLLAQGAVRGLIQLYPKKLYGLKTAGIDLRVLAFSLGVSLLVGLILGLLLVARNSRSQLLETLKTNSGNRLKGSGLQVHGLLATLEIAIACMLLIGAGLLLQSFSRLREVEPGFDPRRVLTMELSLPAEKYAGLEQTSGFLQELLQRITAIPGVESAGAALSLPMAAGFNVDNTFSIEGEVVAKAEEGRTAYLRPVNASYFRTLRIPLRSGRLFSERDDGRAPAVVVVNQAFTRQFFPAKSALGRRLVVGADLGAAGTLDVVPREIVGIVGDVKHRGLVEAAAPEIYFPLSQSPWRLFKLVVRTTQEDPLGLVKPVSQQVWSVDKNLPVDQIQTLEQVLDDSVSQRRFPTLLISAFALLALLLAAVGTYGVVSYSISRQVQEMGLRLALGALPKDLLLGLIGRSTIRIAGGILLGMAGALALGRFLSTLLFGLTTTDAKTFLAVALVLGGVALLASYWPARRALHTDPMTILRTE